MKKRIILALSIFSLLLSACSSNENDGGMGVSWKTTTELKLSAAEENGLKDFSGFGINFLREFAASDQAKENPNFAISPISLTEAVGMIANASDDDANREAIVRTLGFESLAELNTFNEKVMRYIPREQEGLTISLANSFWYNKKLNPSSVLAANLDKYFMASFSGADFNSSKTADIINNWASKYTNGLIKKVITPGAYSTELPFILANATYFSGKWNVPFSLQKKASDFKTYSGKNVKVNLMKPAIANGPFIIDEKISLARTSYYGYKMYLDIIVPTGEGDIYEVASMLTPDKYNELIERLKIVDARNIYLPPFEISSQFSMNSVLDEMGVNLSAMTYSQNGLNSPIQEILLKQFSVLKVNEEGTTGASITTGDIGWASFAEDAVINEPFIFVIGDKATGIVLMAGIVTDPTAM